MKKLPVDEKLAKDAIKPQAEPHIRIVEEKCRGCAARPCLHCCPAKLYTLEPGTGEIRLEHAGCLECGTCLAVCPHDLDWHFPGGGFGVQLRYG